MTAELLKEEIKSELMRRNGEVVNRVMYAVQRDFYFCGYCAFKYYYVAAKLARHYFRKRFRRDTFGYVSTYDFNKMQDNLLNFSRIIASLKTAKDRHLCFCHGRLFNELERNLTWQRDQYISYPKVFVGGFQEFVRENKILWRYEHDFACNDL